MAFGLLSVFLPLYITGSLGGSLIDIGIMTALASFVAVPFSFFWGYLCDKTRKYRIYILLSFLAMTVLLFLFSLTNIVVMLIAVYSAIAVFHVAHEAPKNVLISESYSQNEWKKGFASYEALTEFGWLSGLILGFVLFGYGFSGTTLILLCSALNLIAFVTALLFVKDPILIFERRLVSIERTLSFAHQGISLASQALDGLQIKENLRRENLSIFCAGLLLFSLTTSMLFTPLPVLFSKNLGIPSNLVFGIFALNTTGSFLGYLLAGRMAQKSDGRTVLERANLMRGILPWILLSTVIWFSGFTLTLSVIALIIMGMTYGFFLISTLSLSMELIPEGKAGLFNALVGLGQASGCYIGSFMAANYGFPILFIIVSIGFFLSFIAFKIFAR
jgi:MFS family permease